MLLVKQRARLQRLAERTADAFGLVLLLLCSTFASGSLVSFRGAGAVLTMALASASATVALATSKARRGLIAGSAALSVAVVSLTTVGAARHSGHLLGAAALIEVLLLLAGAGAVLRAVVVADEVGFRTILGAVSVYITLGLLFTFFYIGVDRVQPGPFFGAEHVTKGDSPFFSFTTLTTTGYGNLVPAAQPGKLLAVLEMLMGQIFLVTLIARLVSMWRPGTWLREGPLAEERQRR